VTPSCRYFIMVYFCCTCWSSFWICTSEPFTIDVTTSFPVCLFFFYPFTCSSCQSFCSSSSNFILGCPTYILSADLFLNFLNPSCFNYTCRRDAAADGYLASPSEGHRTRLSVLIIRPVISTCSFKIQNMTKPHIQYPDDSPQQ
jgi:hypothetical protein